MTLFLSLLLLVAEPSHAPCPRTGLPWNTPGTELDALDAERLSRLHPGSRSLRVEARSLRREANESRRNAWRVRQ